MNAVVAKLLKTCGSLHSRLIEKAGRRSRMDIDSAKCREQAAYCAQLLNKKLDPKRRAQLERERQDWLTLAHEQDTWRTLGLDEPAAAFR